MSSNSGVQNIDSEAELCSVDSVVQDVDSEVESV
jgi:hypothetical protein